MNKNKMFLLTAMAGMLNASNDVYGMPTRVASDKQSREESKTNKEKKKCKSCKHFKKEGGKCSCGIGTISWGMYPLRPACGNYKKRKR